MFFRSRPKLEKSTFVKLGLEELECRNLLTVGVTSDFVVHQDQYAQDHIIVQWSNGLPQNTPESTSFQAIGNNTYDVYLQAGVSVAQAICLINNLTDKYDSNISLVSKFLLN